VIFVVDTSGSVAVIATIDAKARSQLELPARDPALMLNLRRIAREGSVTKVAVATGPGSFTGLRVGVSFGLGLAMGLQVPIVPLPALELQAARSAEPATAIVDAGRGRYYYLPPGGEPRLGEPADIPATCELVGNVADRRSLVAAGLRFKAAGDTRRFVDAAEILLGTAPEVPYRSLRIEYMQSFSRKG
jgi:tRNA A37 threonylcarbamoyladenosine modification protein TsaB